MDVDAQWSATLRRIVMPAQLSGSDSNPRTSKYPSGDIWKCILAASIAGDFDSGTEEDTDAKRCIRIDLLGMSGVIFYRVPTRRACTSNNQSKDAEDALIENSSPRVVYFPHFACTSFVTGQVIRAHLLQAPVLSPNPHPFGFSLDSRALETLSRGSIPSRDLSVDLKVTPQCADRVLKDRRRAKQVARLLLATRYRLNTIRNILKVTAASSPSLLEDARRDKPSLADSSCPEDEEEEYHDALETIPHSPLLHSNAPISNLDIETKLLPLRDHRPASNVLAVVDHKEKLLILAREKENTI
ncbi:hypothetical protein B0H17DRAFT_1194276 [Mycena rosella]|uniref:Uncharacterized protein n=1 Tax=Mycena rosella TaxID=1033263 RepID=A0AAD7DYY9_MYCRO|nr:hypothetical protein B0H17DRAFT_1194276 [Mycena rosella]